MFVAAFSDTLYPFGELPVELGPPRLCQTSVCDVARERVLEDVLDLAFERRSRPAANQVAALEQMEVRLDVADELVDRPGPEHASDDRRSLQRSFLGLVEQVDARREHGLDGVWNLEAGRQLPSTPAAVLPLQHAGVDQVAQHLLDEEGISFGAFHDERANLAG